MRRPWRRLRERRVSKNNAGRFAAVAGMGLVCAALLAATPGCARRSQPTEILTLRSEPVRVWRSEALRSYSIKRLAIIPFTHEPKVGPRGRELARMLFGALAQARNYSLVSPVDVDRLLQKMVGEFATGADRRQGVAIARQLAADAVLVGRLVRYQERQGGSWAVAQPASVAFDVELLTVPGNEKIWTASFIHTQRPLSDNLAEFQSFLQQGGKWLTARELMEIGVKQVVAKMPVPEG